MFTFRQQLEIVRQYTGDAFYTKNGYRLNKVPNFGQRMAVLKYFNKIKELSSTETVTYTPKKGEKTEVFQYTGQTGYRKFNKAIIKKISPEQDLKFTFDKRKPKGQRFVVTDKQTGRIYMHIPARFFMLEIDDYDPDFWPFVAYEYSLEGEDENDVLDQAYDLVEALPEEASAALYFDFIIAKHTGEAQFFLIESGESYMWGSGGQRQQIAHKLVELFKTYSATNFDANDKRSSYYGNWFRGVTAFTSRYDVLPRIGQALKKRREYREKWKQHPSQNYRKLKNGLIGVFENGRLINTIVPTWEVK